MSGKDSSRGDFTADDTGAWVVNDAAWRRSH